MPAAPITPSTERSIEPIRMTRVAPTPTISGVAAWSRIVRMLSIVRNVSGLSTANTTIRTTRAPTSPRLRSSNRRCFAAAGGEAAKLLSGGCE